MPCWSEAARHGAHRTSSSGPHFDLYLRTGTSERWAGHAQLCTSTTPIPGPGRLSAPWHGGGGCSKGSGRWCQFLSAAPCATNAGPYPCRLCSACGGLFLLRPKQTEHQGKIRGVATVALSPICGRAQAYAQHRTAHWGTSASRSGTAQGTRGQGWACPTAPQNINYQEY